MTFNCFLMKLEPFFMVSVFLLVQVLDRFDACRVHKEGCPLLPAKGLHDRLLLHQRVFKVRYFMQVQLDMKVLLNHFDLCLKSQDFMLFLSKINGDLIYFRVLFYIRFHPKSLLRRRPGVLINFLIDKLNLLP